MIASWGIGLLSLRQGDLPRALPRLERAVGICQDADLPAWFPRMAAALGAAYTLCGRVADAVPLLTQAMEQATATETVDFQALCRLSLGEAQLLAGRLEEAQTLAERALALAREHQERATRRMPCASSARLPRIAIPRRSSRPKPTTSRPSPWPSELGMRPLQAHCHRGLGHLVCQDRPAGAGPHRTVHRHRAVPRHGHDVLAAPGGGGAGAGGGAVMDFDAVLDQVVDAPPAARAGVLSGAANGSSSSMTSTLDELKEELIYAQQLAVDEEGRVLVWTGGMRQPPPDLLQPRPTHDRLDPGRTKPRRSLASRPATPEAERRQLTVLFCDLVDSTVLASQLDPEEWREVVRAYQETCAKVIARYEGHIAQYLGDGLLVYFGYPQAHEDDAQRAVRAGLGMVEAMGQLNTRLAQERGVQLAVRLGIHTGLVVVGEMGGGGRAGTVGAGRDAQRRRPPARDRGAQYRGDQCRDLPLLGGFFACQSLGTHLLKGVAQPWRSIRCGMRVRPAVAWKRPAAPA